MQWQGRCRFGLKPIALACDAIMDRSCCQLKDGTKVRNENWRVEKCGQWRELAVGPRDEILGGWCHGGSVWNISTSNGTMIDGVDNVNSEEPDFHPLNTHIFECAFQVSKTGKLT